MWRVMSDYVDIKTVDLLRQIQHFENKWNMTFSEFSQGIEEKNPAIHINDYEVEKDFWAWEEAVTLLAHYQTLQPA